MKKIIYVIALGMLVSLVGCQKTAVSQESEKEAVADAVEYWNSQDNVQKNMYVQFEHADGKYQDEITTIKNKNLYESEAHRTGMPSEKDNVHSKAMWNIKDKEHIEHYMYDSSTKTWTVRELPLKELEQFQMDMNLGINSENIREIVSDEKEGDTRILELEMDSSKSSEWLIKDLEEARDTVIVGNPPDLEKAEENLKKGKSVIKIWIDTTNGVPLKIEKDVTDERIVLAYLVGDVGYPIPQKALKVEELISGNKVKSIKLPEI